MIHRGLLKKLSACCGFFEKSRDNGVDAAIHATLAYYALTVPVEYRNDIGINANHILSTEKFYKV
ncbi:MAG: hypothetical protein PHU31_02200 [Anaerotignum sp.]|nr:hypothetical protein [Anaerotignum sp.]